MAALAAVLAIAAFIPIVAAQATTGGGTHHGRISDKVLFFASDGMRQDLVEKYAGAGVMPTMKSFLRTGVKAQGNGLLTQAPPNTGAGWYTLATGAWPGVHGSTNNTFHKNSDPMATRTAAFDPNTLQAVGQGVVVRFVYRPGEVGYDAFHGICITERLSGKPGEAPATRYEYDYVDGAYGDRRSLDSAFFVEYDEEVMGHRKWRQRNLTVVGGGDSLCIVAFAPVAVWNKSSAARTALEAVVQNVTFRQ